jgi:hypothetical protein
MLLKEITLFLLPLLLAGLMHHFLIIKRNLFPVLAKPIDGGLQLGQKRLFGDSKTWRGFIAMAFLTGIIFWPFSIFLNLPLKIHPLPAGILLGLAYSLGELPNSFIKRILGLKEGAITKGPARLIQHLFDQTDSIIGALLALPLLYAPSLSLIVFLFLAGTLLHITVDLALYAFGYKRTPASRPLNQVTPSA